MLKDYFLFSRQPLELLLYYKYNWPLIVIDLLSMVGEYAFYLNSTFKLST